MSLVPVKLGECGRLDGFRFPPTMSLTLELDILDHTTSFIDSVDLKERWLLDSV
jgi:hypothetical protein